MCTNLVANPSLTHKPQVGSVQLFQQPSVVFNHEPTRFLLPVPQTTTSTMESDQQLEPITALNSVNDTEVVQQQNQGSNITGGINEQVETTPISVAASIDPSGTALLIEHLKLLIRSMMHDLTPRSSCDKVSSLSTCLSTFEHDLLTQKFSFVDQENDQQQQQQQQKQQQQQQQQQQPTPTPPPQQHQSTKIQQQHKREHSVSEPVVFFPQRSDSQSIEPSHASDSQGDMTHLPLSSDSTNLLRQLLTGGDLTQLRRRSGLLDPNFAHLPPPLPSALAHQSTDTDVDYVNVCNRRSPPPLALVANLPTDSRTAKTTATVHDSISTHIVSPSLSTEVPDSVRCTSSYGQGKKVQAIPSTLVHHDSASPMKHSTSLSKLFAANFPTCSSKVRQTNTEGSPETVTSTDSSSEVFWSVRPRSYSDLPHRVPPIDRYPLPTLAKRPRSQTKSEKRSWSHLTMNESPICSSSVTTTVDEHLPESSSLLAQLINAGPISSHSSGYDNNVINNGISNHLANILVKKPGNKLYTNFTSNGPTIAQVNSVSSSNLPTDRLPVLMCNTIGRNQVYEWLRQADLYVTENGDQILPGALLATALDPLQFGEMSLLHGPVHSLFNHLYSKPVTGNEHVDFPAPMRYTLSKLWPHLLLISFMEHRFQPTVTNCIDPVQRCLPRSRSSITNVAQGNEQIRTKLLQAISSLFELDQCTSPLPDLSLVQQISNLVFLGDQLRLTQEVYANMRSCVMAQAAYPRYFSIPYDLALCKLEACVLEIENGPSMADVLKLLGRLHCFDAGTLKLFFGLTFDRSNLLISEAAEETEDDNDANDCSEIKIENVPKQQQLEDLRSDWSSIPMTSSFSTPIKRRNAFHSANKLSGNKVAKLSSSLLRCRANTMCLSTTTTRTTPRLLTGPRSRGINGRPRSDTAPSVHHFL